MRPIVRILCGSHLYGTNISGSGRDYKIVYMPDAKRILLQQADRLDPEDMPPVVEQLKKDARLNRDPDVEFMSLKQYLKLLCEGQTNALDMFFAPQKFYVGKPAPEWYAIQNHAHRWISKNSAAFVGYCRQQVAKYAVKMDRYDAVRSAVTFFAKVPDLSGTKVGMVGKDALDSLVASSEHIEWITRETAHGAQLSHLSVCQTMIPVTATCKVALDTFSRKLDSYGERVQKAAKMEAKDWKSLYHAVRVAEEALELMQTGKLTFPRPERNLLRAIRLGKVPFNSVSTMIEENLQRVEKSVKESNLPEQPDWDYADELVASLYRNVVLCERP